MAVKRGTLPAKRTGGPKPPATKGAIAKPSGAGYSRTRKAQPAWMAKATSNRNVKRTPIKKGK